MAFDTKRATRNAGGDLGRVIRSIRLRINLGQTALARLLRWPQASLSQYESGDARPSAERLIGLLRLASTDDERGPILKALEAYGILAWDLASTFAPPREGSEAAASIVPVSSGVDRTSISEFAISAEQGGA